MIKPNLFDKAIGYFAPQTAFKRAAAREGMSALGQYRGSESTRLRQNWAFGNDDANPDIWETSDLKTSSQDLNRNDPIASGMTETMGMNIVGKGLRPQSQLRAEYLPISEDKARELRKQIENIFLQKFAPYSDSANMLDFDEQQFMVMRKVVEDGGILAVPTWADEPWRPIGRCIELLETSRLDSSKGVNSTGIDLGGRSQPKTYHIKKTDPKKKGILSESSPVDAFDASGRPKILHVFPQKRPGQLTGVPMFAPIISMFEQLGGYVEAEVVKNRIAACLAVLITTEGGNVPGQTESVTGDPLQHLEPGLIARLKKGESANVVAPNTPGDGFAPFLEGMARMLGLPMGLPYEMVFKDFSKTNYSSARASLLEARRMFMYWRSWLARRFCQPVWSLVVEEAYYRGMFDAPKFLEYKHEYCRAAWIGGGWGWVDPVKEIKASKMAIDYGLSTYAKECGGQGDDWEETFEQRDREENKKQELGLSLEEAKNKEIKPYQGAANE